MKYQDLETVWVIPSGDAPAWKAMVLRDRGEDYIEVRDAETLIDRKVARKNVRRTA